MTFMRPEAFLLLLPVFGIVLAVLYLRTGKSDWSKAVDPHLLNHLTVKQTGSYQSGIAYAAIVAWLVAVIALAGPSFFSETHKAKKALSARVIVFDVSKSMDARDLAQDRPRTDRARYKAQDILERSQGRLVGLVAFAGVAYLVTPLTEDVSNIDLYLASLNPDLIPEQGSRIDRGVERAVKALTDSGRRTGEIILITDSPAKARTFDAVAKARRAGFTVSVLGVGTASGAPIPDGKGDNIRRADGSVVIARLDIAGLRQLADRGGGQYATISYEDDDLEHILQDDPVSADKDAEEKDMTARSDFGYWLTLLLLPFAAAAFRRGWVFCLAAVMAHSLVPQPAYADDLQQRVLSAKNNNFSFETQDQAAYRAYQRGDYQLAEALFTKPEWRGLAQIKAGKNQAAIATLKNVQTGLAQFNLGNALARDGQLEEAISAYKKSQALDPKYQAIAQKNLSLVSQALKAKQAAQEEQANLEKKIDDLQEQLRQLNKERQQKQQEHQQNRAEEAAQRQQQNAKINDLAQQRNKARKRADKAAAQEALDKAHQDLANIHQKHAQNQQQDQSIMQMLNERKKKLEQQVQQLQQSLKENQKKNGQSQPQNGQQAKQSDQGKSQQQGQQGSAQQSQQGDPQQGQNPANTGQQAGKQNGQPRQGNAQSGEPTAFKDTNKDGKPTGERLDEKSAGGKAGDQGWVDIENQSDEQLNEQIDSQYSLTEEDIKRQDKQRIKRETKLLFKKVETDPAHLLRQRLRIKRLTHGETTEEGEDQW